MQRTSISIYGLAGPGTCLVDNSGIHPTSYYKTCKNKMVAAMTWRTLPNIKGKVYVPDSPGSAKKHPCPDCCACQMCGPQRCHVCRDTSTAFRPRANSTAMKPHGSMEANE